MTKIKIDLTMTLREFERCMGARGVKHVSMTCVDSVWRLRGVGIFHGDTREIHFAEDGYLATAMFDLIEAMPKICYKCGASIEHAVLHDTENERCKACADPE